MRYVKLEELKKLPGFNGLDENILRKLSNIIRVNRYEKAKVLFRDKDIVDNIYIVLKGKASLYKFNEKGQKKVIFILGEGDFINEVILQNSTSSINCETIEDSQIMHCNTVELLQVMEENFELTKIVLYSLSLKVRRMYRQFKNTTGVLSMGKRVASKLWKLGRDYGVPLNNGILIDMEISITYLADLFGAQRETISRACKELSELGLIEYSNKKFIIKDEEKLLEYFKTP
ncbi:Crp/Fnr family transcriptional regulator [Clostridium subterminale]|uniref:Crp/Fnr family transcriptional regulator n=1 Tax=Clostridium subterminale TaxID=1550 RepID=A0ABP3VX20_CLOSU